MVHADNESSTIGNMKMRSPETSVGVIMADDNRVIKHFVLYMNT